MIALSAELHVPIYELEENLTMNQLQCYSAFYAIKADEQKKQMQEMKSQGKSNRKTRPRKKRK